MIEATSQPEPPGDARSLTVAIVGAIGTGIGGLGFFTFAGSAIALARFRGAGLPGVQALSAVPRTELLIIGFDQLVVPMVAGLGIVLMLSVLYPKLTSAPLRAGVLVVIAAGGVLDYLLRVAPPLYDEGQHRLMLTAALLVAAAGITLAYRRGEQSLASAQRVGGRPRLFGFGAIVFVTAALFSAIELYADALNEPKVKAGAALLSGDARPVVGLYVGETGGPASPTASRLYIGKVSPRREEPAKGVKASARLIAIPQVLVVAVAVGPVEPLPDAVARGPRLLDELKRHAPSTVQPPQR